MRSSSNVVRPRLLHLCEASPVLMAFNASAEMELPGQYLQDEAEPVPEAHIKIHSLHPDAVVMPWTSNFARSVGFTSSNGRTYWYRVHGALDCPTAEAAVQDELLCQFARFTNTLVLQKHHLTAARGVSIQVPTTVTLFPRLRLSNVPADPVSLWQLYDTWARKESRYGSSETATAAAAQDTLHPASHRALRALYSPIVDGARSQVAVPDTILFNWLMERSVTQERMFENRRSLRRYVASTGVLAHVLGLAAASPAAVHVNTVSMQPNASAQQTCFQSEFTPDNASSSGSTNPSAVHFRLTPNITKVLSEVGGHGALKAAMTATVLALHANRDALRDLLLLYHRDSTTTGSNQPTSRSKTEAAMERFDSLCSPIQQSGGAGAAAASNNTFPFAQKARLLGTHSQVSHLIHAASRRANLEQQPPTWMPML